MFGINKIKLDVERLWNTIERVDKTALCALKDGDVISRSNKEAHKLIEEQSRAIYAIARHLGVKFEGKRVPDPSWTVPQPATMEILVCVPNPTAVKGLDEGGK